MPPQSHGRPDGVTPQSYGRPDAPQAPHTRPESAPPRGSHTDAQAPHQRPDAPTRQPGPARADTPPHHGDPARTDPPGQHTPDRHPDSGPRHDGQQHDNTQHDNTPGDGTPGDRSPLHPDVVNARHAEVTPAGVSHHGGDSDMGDLPHRVPHDPRFFTADVHVTPDGHARIGGRDHTPEQYAELLRRSGYDGSRPVRLIGCDAGSTDFARRLSRELDAPVVAPDKPAWTDTRGRVYSSDTEIGPDGTRRPKIPPTGQWDTHHPDGTRTSAGDDGYAPGTRDTDRTDRTDPDGARDRGQDDADRRERADTDSPPPDMPSATSRVEDPVSLPEPSDPHPAGMPETHPQTGPADKKHGALLEQLDPDSDRVTVENGLITHVDDVPVREYVERVARERADLMSQSMGRKDGPVSAVAIDLRTGTITEGVNGKANALLPAQDLHPLLQDNYRRMAEWRHPVETEPGVLARSPFDPDQDVVLDGQAHFDKPLRHAEVKAVNELLWARQRSNPDVPLTPEVLDELRFDPRWLADGQHMRRLDPAPACANCNQMLRGVPSYSGRLQFAPGDYRYDDSLHGFAEW
ncbi:YwqJ-related putative deaminase [Umezawaea beigongshangensis]|uniref:YwqJ-related putative deaminase n=1 Tax=Umezawaea beigongshangensis TaxID=2780383 RepID=UPI0018F1DB70|nr:YwqJ-related putative deaminase [Umezawaea beigongshangensis]